MTPEQFRQFKAELEAFQATPGYDIERRARAVEVIRHIFAENAVELEGALIAFKQPEMHPLMLQDHREQLQMFLMLVQRRFYNHLATAASVVDHLRRVFQRMPSILAQCAGRLLEQVDSFAAADRYQIVIRLRDHSIHHQFHLTTAHMTFVGSGTSANPHEQPTATEILLEIGAVRRTGASRRSKKHKRREDPLRNLPDQIELLALVKNSQTDTEALADNLKSILNDEYRHYETAVENTRARLRELYEQKP